MQSYVILKCLVPLRGYTGMCEFLAILDINKARVLSRELPTPNKFFWEYPPCQGLKFCDIHRCYKHLE